MFKNIILMMILIVSSSVATEINWAKDYNDGIIKAKKADKPLLFIVSNKNCPPCKKLARNTLGDSRVIKVLNKDFVSVIAYVSFTDPSVNDFVPKELNTGVTPTLWFLVPNHDIIYSPIKGPPTADMMLNMLEQVKAEEKKAKGDKK